MPPPAPAAREHNAPNQPGVQPGKPGGAPPAPNASKVERTPGEHQKKKSEKDGNSGAQGN